NKATAMRQINVTAQGLTIDAIAFRDQSTAATTWTPTNAFSTTASNELLLAFLGTSSTTATTATVSGAGLAWSMVQRRNTSGGTAEIWSAFASSPLSNVTVTATMGASVTRTGTLTVVSFKNVDTSGTNGA